MLYDYYCTNLMCGKKFGAEQIVFDLDRMINDSDDGSLGYFIAITPQDIAQLIAREGKQPDTDEKVLVNITLKDFLRYLSRELSNENDAKELQELTHNDIANENEKLTGLLDNSKQRDEVKQKNISEMAGRITASCVYVQPPSEETPDGWEDDTSHYRIPFYIRQIFFPGTKTLDTIEFSYMQDVQNLNRFNYHGHVIRGFCPECHQPVLRAAGMYPHKLVGLLGAQSSGKTTLFVSMINYLMETWNAAEELKINTDLLADGKFDYLQRACKLNEKGFAVKKTDAQGNIEESFNASILIKKEGSRDEAIILTFVDIGGDVCYDHEKKDDVDPEAFSKFPLITSCHIYMPCCCVAMDAYGQGRGEEGSAKIPAYAIQKILTEIYNRRKKSKDRKEVPPMCLVITKVDLADAAEKGGNTEENPFKAKEFKVPRDLDKEEVLYSPYKQIERLRVIFDTTGDKRIIEALQWAYATAKTCEGLTYYSIISCSATGMQGEMYKDTMDMESDGSEFRSINLDVLWKYILCNFGISPSYKNYCLPYVPSFGEGYKIPGFDSEVTVRTDFDISDQRRRTEAVRRLYLNRSELDEKLIQYNNDEDELTPVEKALRDIKEKFQGRRDERIVRDYLTGKVKNNDE